MDSYTELFEDKLLPLALQVGCSPHEFWYENPKLFWQRIEAYNERKKEEVKLWQYQVNVSSWVQGQYLMAAIGACLSKDFHYPQSPIPIFKNDNESIAGDTLPAMSQSEIQIRNQVQKAKDALDLMNGNSPKIVGGKRI